MTHDEAKQLKYRFMKRVTNPLNKDYSDLISVIKSRPVLYNIICSNHFFERVIERDVDRGKLGSIFNKLFEHHYCSLLHYFHVNKADIELNQHDPAKRHCIHVKYKSLGVVFLLGISERTCDSYGSIDFEVIPITVINNEDYIKDTVMVFDLNKNRKELKLYRYDVSNEKICISL